MLQHDPSDGRAARRVAQVLQRALDAGVAPGWILFGHANNEVTDLLRFAWSTGTTLRAPIILLRDKFPVPPKQSVWCDEGREFLEHVTADLLRLRCQSAPLSVGEEKTLVADLLPEDAVLFLEVLDHVLLLAIHPACERNHEEVEWV